MNRERRRESRFGTTENNLRSVLSRAGANGYAEYVAKNLDDFTVHFGMSPLDSRLAGNIEAIYAKAGGQ